MTEVEIRSDAPDVYERFRAERGQSLVGVEDDMWATFADMAEPHALVIDGQVVGSCSIDDEDQLHSFHITQDAQRAAPEVLANLVEGGRIAAIIASTVDPGCLSLGLSVADRTEPVALMYEHVAESEEVGLVELRPAGTSDHRAAVDFAATETDSPEAFLDFYFGQRIERQELFLVEDDHGRISATGECRDDPRADGHAHLGLIVGTTLRDQGLGSRLMHSLIEMAVDRGATPLCSTEPSNLAAQRVIHRTGFRTRHRVLRLHVGSDR